MPDEQKREYDSPSPQISLTEKTAPEDQAYPLEEVMKAQSVLRSAARMAPERYPLPQIIGMLSDEIQALREKGRSDDEIAAIITGNSLIHVDADCLQRFYATPEQRGKDDSEAGHREPIVY